MKRSFAHTRLARAIALTSVLTLAFASLALADTLDVDANVDDTTTVVGSKDLGTVAPGAVLTPKVNFILDCAGRQHVDRGQSVIFTFNLQNSTVPAGGSLAADGGSVTAPNDWPLDQATGSSNCPTPNPQARSADVEVTITAPTDPGPYTYAVRWNSALDYIDQNALTGPGHVIATFTLTVQAAVTNQPPTAPGKPTPNIASPNQGGFTLNWTASTDDGLPNPPGALTYNLQAKDADDPQFGTVVDGAALTTNSYTFAANNPAEGTWVFRVEASDSELTSDWSDESDPIKVDRTAPNFGACPAGGPFIVGGGLQSVGPISATDPNLLDGSAGSGVDSDNSTLSESVDTSTVGTKQVTFTAVDNAGNSRQTTCNYSVVYGFSGYGPPIAANGFLNNVKAGQTVVFSFQLTDADGNGVQASGAILGFTAISCSGDMVDEVDVADVSTNGKGLTYLGDGYHRFLWQSPKSLAGGCRTVALDFGDGVKHGEDFQFKK